MKIAVYCSANNNIDPDFFKETQELGHWIARNGYDLVFGGTNTGLMECIGKAVKEAGGRTIGVVPQIIEKGGRTFGDLDVDIPCDNLSDRKELMTAQSDVAIALPGGIGTLDEVFSTASSATIGYHNERVIMYNMKGFWNSLRSLMDDLQARNMIRGDYKQHIEFADSLDDIAGIIGGMI